MGGPSAEFLERVPRDFARRHLLVSAGREGESERLLVSERSAAEAVHNVGVRLGRAVVTEVRDGEDVARAVDAAYTADAQEAGNETAADAAGAPADDAAVARLLEEGDGDLLATAGKGELVRLVDGLLFGALGRGASDVHIQPVGDRVLVRARVDGVLHTVRELPAKLGAPLISRVKVMGRMDIAERRLAQDGRATVRLGARTIDLRIGTFPTSHGERAVLRLLERAGGSAGGLADLGMPEGMRERFLRHADRASGIVLVTGPTGSGKTTTLYATLRWLALHHAGQLNIMTIEDPIEYELSAWGSCGIAISQGQVNARKGITFASGLRHILRQDPDVIMVGEVRDADTARIAIQASLTGHLVFSTLHTGDAPGAVTRLVDLGVEPYLVAASLSAVLAQRLVRRVHGACGGRGCDACLLSGFLGRTGVFELLAVDEAMRELLSRGGGTAQVRDHARACGMRSLEEEGERLVRDGVTTELEVARVIDGGAH